METAPITSWTLIQEIPIPDDVTDLLIEGEQAVAAYKTFRDSAIFTTKRLIVRDAQGLAGKKVEIHSLPTVRSTCGRRRTPARCLTSTRSLRCGPGRDTSR